MTKPAAIARRAGPGVASPPPACHVRPVRHALHLVTSGRAGVRDTFSRRYRVLGAGLAASLALHAALIALERSDARVEAPRSPAAIVARIAPPAPAAQPVTVAETQRPAAASPTATPQAAVPVARPIVPSSKPALTSTRVDVMIAHDTEPAIDAMFEATLRRDRPGAQRIALEFEVAPVVHLPPQVMGHVPQRMLRALVQIDPHGEMSLLQTHEYDVPYMDAIRDALHAARAARPPDGETRWAILVFWFHRIGEAVTK
jgi:hypothetical protein